MLRRRHAPLLLAAAAGAALAASSAVSPSGDGRGVPSALHGVARSSRAIYTIGFVVVDYKYSLRGLAPGSEDYQVKLSEVHLRSAKKLLKLCEANGGFYVKAGQSVSSLKQAPKEYSSTLSCLQDQTTPCNFQDIKMVIEHNFGKDLRDIFLEFDEHPIAAASIAQVHRGRLNNQEVAVKIYPDYRFEKILIEFERTMSMEPDFTQEAKNSKRTASCFRKNNVVKVPHVFWELTTKEILTMEFCYGHKVDDLDFLRKADISPTEVAKALIEMFGEMIFVHGFVHGDPHPGNILVSPQGQGRFSLAVESINIVGCPKILELGEQFGVGKYAKYFPVIFTGRTIESKSVLGTQLSGEEKRRLKQDLNSLGMDDISSFMESLPPDFLIILRTDGLLRSILANLGAPRHVRFLAYAKCAIYGLEEQSKLESGAINRMFLQVRTDISYLHLRIIIEFAGFLAQVNDLRHKVMKKLRRMLQEISRDFVLLWWYNPRM